MAFQALENGLVKFEKSKDKFSEELPPQ